MYFSGRYLLGFRSWQSLIVLRARFDSFCLPHQICSGPVFILFQIMAWLFCLKLCSTGLESSRIFAALLELDRYCDVLYHFLIKDKASKIEMTPGYYVWWLRKKSDFCVALHPVVTAAYYKYASSHGILDALNSDFLLCHRFWWLFTKPSCLNIETSWKNV